MNQVKKINILEVSRGALMEQIDFEIKKVLDNLQDPNTDWKAARSLEIKLTFQNKDDKREVVDVASQAKAKLVPNMPLKTMLYSEIVNGEVLAAELSKPDPRQVTFEEEQGTATTNMINMADAKKARTGNG